MTPLAILAAFIRRDWIVARSYHAAWVLEIGSVVVSLALFFYLAELVDETELARSADLETGYFAFTVVGISLLRVFSAGLSSFSSRLRDDQTTGTLEALMAAPVSSRWVILGSAAYDMLYALVLSAVTILVAVVFFGLDLTIGPALLVAIVVGLPGIVGLFASLGVAVAAFTLVVKRGAGLLDLITTALAVLGGVYFPISELPDVLESLANLIPFTWAVDVLRSALLAGELDVDRLVFLVVSAAVALPLAFLLFDRALDRARRDGSLAQY